MKKQYFLFLFLICISFSFGSLSVSIEYSPRMVPLIWTDSSGDYHYEMMEINFVDTITVADNSDLSKVRFIGIRPTESSPVSIGHGTINLYDSSGNRLYFYGCLDEHLDFLQQINGAYSVYHIGASDVYSASYDTWGNEDLWRVTPYGNVPLELVFVPEPCGLTLLFLGGLALRYRKS